MWSSLVTYATRHSPNITTGEKLDEERKMEIIKVL